MKHSKMCVIAMGRLSLQRSVGSSKKRGSMNRLNFIAIVVFIFLSKNAFSEGATLVDSRNFVKKSDETKLLNENEKKIVERFRKDTKNFKLPFVTTLNKFSLNGGAITIVDPNTNKEYRFVGGATIAEGSNGRVWSGKDNNRASIMISDDDDGTSGVLRDAGKIVHIYALPGKRFYVFAEHVPHPMIEPVPVDLAPRIRVK